MAALAAGHPPEVVDAMSVEDVEALGIYAYTHERGVF